MITLYRTDPCPRCDDIQEWLESRSLAHQIKTVSKGVFTPEGVDWELHPPVMIDDNNVYEGSDAIGEHMQELEEFKAEWEKFQSDACYCDE